MKSKCTFNYTKEIITYEIIIMIKFNMVITELLSDNGTMRQIYQNFILSSITQTKLRTRQPIAGSSKALQSTTRRKTTLHI
jgi:hypothetical protein